MEVESFSEQPLLDTKLKKTSPDIKHVPENEEYALRKTYLLNFAKLGFPGLHDFNAYDFFINAKPIADTSIYFDTTTNMVHLNTEGSKQMTLLEFLLALGIGLHQGAFKIQDYVLSSPEQRQALEEPENLPN